MTIDKQQEDLKNQFNEFFSKHNIQDFYSQLSVQELIELKKIYSCINNIITHRATIAFINLLCKDGFISLTVCEDMLKCVNAKHANTNGFDVQYMGEQGPEIIAEVKCNIPVHKESFGSEQKCGIIKDIWYLQNGKSKAKISDTSQYYKFMVVLDCNENVKKCMRKIIAKQDKVKEYTTPNSLDKEHVYVMYVTI